MKLKQICTVLFIGMTVMVLFSTSCKKSIRGEGDVITKTIQPPSFIGIENSISADVYVTQAAVQKVEISAQSNIIDNITLEVKNGIWGIGFDKNVRKHEPINIYISIPQLSSYALSGSGNFYTNNVFDSCGTVSFNISGSGNIDAHLNSNTKTYSSISGSGNITLSGNSPYQDITISGSGNLNAFPFHTYHSIVKISGSGNCQLTADSTLNVTISGSGNVYYKGYPVINVNNSGSGGLFNAN